MEERSLEERGIWAYHPRFARRLEGFLEGELAAGTR